MTLPLDMGTFTLSQAPMNYIMIWGKINDNGNYYPVYTDYEYVSITNPYAFLSVNSIDGNSVQPNFAINANLTANSTTNHAVSVTVYDDWHNPITNKPVP